MTIRAFRRELFTQHSAASLFDALVGDQSVAFWIDIDNGGESPRALLGSGQLLCFEGPDAFDQWRTQWNELRVPDPENDVPLGLVVVVPYDTARHTLGLDASAVNVSDWDQPIRCVVVRRSVSVDQRSGAVVAWALGDDESAIDDWAAQVHRANAAAHTESPVAQTGEKQTPHWRNDPEDYRQLISHARESIRQGEAYQLCLTTQVQLEATLSDVDLHRLLRSSSPAPYQALLRLGELSVVSASPETFLRINPDGEVITRPIKGTRPRGDSPDEDTQLVDQLRGSDKEQAENLMIVDLMRNDLLRVCDSNSIEVTGLFDVESYSSVHQLVSTVRGRLREGLDALDALHACFPAGSMTGAPKHRAVELLAAWEHGPRGIYSGAWGWCGVDGSMDLAMTIRTAVIADGVVSVGVGGGITWSSQPDDEIAEVGHKARRLLEALGAAQIKYS